MPAHGRIGHGWGELGQPSALEDSRSRGSVRGTRLRALLSPRRLRGIRLGVLDWIALALLATGVAFVATGLLPAHEASATVRRLLPLLLFLATILVLAELTA